MERITPAHAGKSCVSPESLLLPEDHPRACGEKGLLVLLLVGWMGSPPRMRGKGPAGAPVGRLAGITPAHAGKRAGQVRSWTAF